MHAGTPVRLETAGGEVSAGVVVIATGLSNGRLGLPGEEELVGRGLSTCAGCDGPLYRGKAVAVVGDDEWTSRRRWNCRGDLDRARAGEPRWSPQRAERLRAAERVEVLTGAEVTALRADGVLAGITVRTRPTATARRRCRASSEIRRRGPADLVAGATADEAGALVTEDGVPPPSPRARGR